MEAKEGPRSVILVIGGLCKLLQGLLCLFLNCCEVGLRVLVERVNIIPNRKGAKTKNEQGEVKCIG